MWLPPILGYHSQGFGRTILTLMRCSTTLPRSAGNEMRRSLKLESLGTGYRCAHVMASWSGNHSARVAATPPQQLAVTIITMEEVLGVWYTQIRQARDDQQLARAYRALHEDDRVLPKHSDKPFDLPEISLYHQLRTQHRRIGTNDLRIAAIVLEEIRNSGDTQYD